MKICILADSHDNIQLLEAAVANAKTDGASVVLHCGDIVAPSTLTCLFKHGLPIHVIHGNNSGDLYALVKLAAQSDNLLHYHGMDAMLQLADRRVFMVHYPHYAYAMAVTGNWDLVCYGHNHLASQEVLPNIRGNNTTLINPGTVGGVGHASATYMLGDLMAMTFELKYLVK